MRKRVVWTELASVAGAIVFARVRVLAAKARENSKRLHPISGRLRSSYAKTLLALNNNPVSYAG